MSRIISINEDFLVENNGVFTSNTSVDIRPDGMPDNTLDIKIHTVLYDSAGNAIKVCDIGNNPAAFTPDSEIYKAFINQATAIFHATRVATSYFPFEFKIYEHLCTVSTPYTIQSTDKRISITFTNKNIVWTSSEYPYTAITFKAAYSCPQPQLLFKYLDALVYTNSHSSVDSIKRSYGKVYVNNTDYTPMQNRRYANETNEQFTNAAYKIYADAMSSTLIKIPDLFTFAESISINDKNMMDSFIKTIPEKIVKDPRLKSQKYQDAFVKMISCDELNSLLDDLLSVRYAEKRIDSDYAAIQFPNNFDHKEANNLNLSAFDIFDMTPSDTKRFCVYVRTNSNIIDVRINICIIGMWAKYRKQKYSERFVYQYPYAVIELTLKDNDKTKQYEGIARISEILYTYFKEITPKSFLNYVFGNKTMEIIDEPGGISKTEVANIAKRITISCDSKRRK